VKSSVNQIVYETYLLLERVYPGRVSNYMYIKRCKKQNLPVTTDYEQVSKMKVKSNARM